MNTSKSVRIQAKVILEFNFKVPLDAYNHLENYDNVDEQILKEIEKIERENLTNALDGAEIDMGYDKYKMSIETLTVEEEQTV